jgi:phage gp29-like protein
VSASGVWIYWYPSGNEKAKQEVAHVAQERAHTNVILMPRDAEVEQYGVDQVPFNAAGVEVLERLIREHFGHLIKRLILGQTLSSEADATGLGSGLADLQSDTMRQIVKFDSINQQETITRDLLWELRDRNFPNQRDVDVQFKVDTDADEPERILEAARQLWEMGAELPEATIMEKAGISPPKPGDKVLRNPVIMQQTRLAEQHLEKGGQGGEIGQPGLLDQLMGDAGGDMPQDDSGMPGAEPQQEMPGEEVPEPFELAGGAQAGPVMHKKEGFAYRYFRGGNYHVQPADDGLVITQR